MHVLQVSTATIGGGASRVMLQLHAAWRARGLGTTVLTRHRLPEQAGQDVVTLAELLGEGDGALPRAHWYAAARAERWLNWPHLHTSTRRLPRTALWRQADVVHLHNLHGEYFNYLHLPRLGLAKPLVWTLHDMWALTGWCTFTRDCDRWETGCHHCPQLKELAQLRRRPWLNPPDRTQPAWRAKARAFGQTRLHVVAPSRWLHERAAKSILRGAALHYLPNGVDLETFRPLDKAAARAQLGLPPQAAVVLFSATTLHNRRKGFEVLLHALRQLQVDRDWWLLTVGSDLRGAGQTYPGPYLGLGFVNDDARLNLAYNAADVVALPSLAENHPLVLLEALAAGTPAAAFDVGGASEITRHEQTGYLARYGQADDLARGLAWTMADADRRAALGRNCRALAKAEFDEALMVERYLALYAEAKRDGRPPTTDD